MTGSGSRGSARCSRRTFTWWWASDRTACWSTTRYAVSTGSARPPSRRATPTSVRRSFFYEGKPRPNGEFATASFRKIRVEGGRRPFFGKFELSPVRSGVADADRGQDDEHPPGVERRVGLV